MIRKKLRDQEENFSILLQCDHANIIYRWSYDEILLRCLSHKET